VAWTRAALGLAVAGAVALVLVSGGSDADPRTPAGPAGMPPPFLGTAVAGSGGLTAAVDAYGDVVDLRGPGPAGRGLIDNPADRQAAGTVSAATGIVPRVSVGGGPARALWQADSVSQRYLPGTNVVRAVGRFGRVRVAVTSAAVGEALAEVVDVDSPAGAAVTPTLAVNFVPDSGIRCERSRQPHRLAVVCRAAPSAAPSPRSTAAESDQLIRAAAGADRHWLSRARPLGAGAPPWARRMYTRSLLTLRALSDRRSGAIAAGTRDGWAYVWPRDAGTAALAFAAAGYPAQARRLAGFLLGLDLDAAARFHGDGTPVPGRGPQGDGAGWVAIAARAAALPPSAVASSRGAAPWGPNRPDYQEGTPGEYLANAIAATSPTQGVSDLSPHIGPVKSDTPPRRGGEVAADRIAGRFGTGRGLVRRAGDPASGLDSAAAWAVRPFAMPGLYPTVRKTLLRLAADQTRFGITPGEGWPGVDPWSAPTAWTAWSLAALGERRQALGLLGDLRRAATPAGALPERVDVDTGVPRSTTPLAWTHAFAILALRELWPKAGAR
jgi:hypothetical protein